MDLATIEAPPEEAKAKLDEYRAAVRETHDEVDRQIMKGYEELAKGRSLIRLTESIRVGGFDENGLPRLAIARMTDARVECQVQSDQLIFSPSSNRWPQERAGLNAGVVRVAVARPNDTPEASRRWRGQAIVPLVPPTLRPKRAQHRYFVLFEAEWDLVPPIDPALIRHLVGDLWVVVASWDLTELERAAIAGR